MLIKSTASDFPTLYKLLQCSFPEDEYRPYETQLALLQDPQYTLYTNADRSALISLWRFDAFTFIEHFAVTPDLRGQGQGTKILQQILSAASTPVILEAELPDTEMAQRRLHFYQRNGFTINSVPYLQPAYAPDRNPIPMCLLSTSPLCDEEFSAVRNTLYREVYKMIGRS